MLGALTALEVLGRGLAAVAGKAPAACGELPEQGIPTTAVCASCGKRWQRDHGDQGGWHRLPQ